MSTPLHLYFAYGSNLNLQQMQRRCPDSQPVGRAALHGYRLVFPRDDEHWAGGVAGLAPDASNHVEGALYELSDADVSGLDQYEGLDEGEYTRWRVEVVSRGGETIAATTYFATPAGEGWPYIRPSRAYLEAIVQGARQHGLSPQWIEMLQNHRSLM